MANQKHDNHGGQAELIEACKEALVLLRHLGKNRDDFLAVELLEDALAKINQEQREKNMEKIKFIDPESGKEIEGESVAEKFIGAQKWADTRVGGTRPQRS